MCLYQNKCMREKSTGVFLSLIKRKKITRLDEKHLILMAEKRGLFGDTNPKKERARIQSRSAKKDEHIIQPVKIKRKRSEEIALLVNDYDEKVLISRLISIDLNSFHSNRLIVYHNTHIHHVFVQIKCGSRLIIN